MNDIILARDGQVPNLPPGMRQPKPLMICPGERRTEMRGRNRTLLGIAIIILVAIGRTTVGDFDSVSIEPEGNAYAAYGHGTYPDSSVLAGQSQRAWLDSGTLPELQARFPQADVLEHSTRPYRDPDASLADLSGLPSEPPGWFDPGAAGESWDDDY